MLTNLLIFGVLYIITVFVNGWIVKLLLKSFQPDDLPVGMPNAGRMIGYLERALILTFLIIGQPTLIGFVLTVKAIYRYGDIQGDCNTKMKLSEYFIIGTLISVLLTVLIYVVFKNIYCN
jgi:hypothetical protein